MKHPSPLRRSAMITLQKAGRPEGAVLSVSRPEPRPESLSERKRPFLEDFNMEHSCSNVTVALRAFSAASESGEQARSRNPAALSINTPTCVYLG